MTRSKLQIHFIIHLIVLLLIMNMLGVIVTQEFFDLEETPSASAPELSDPSDLSAGLNLVPVTNLIAAAANAVPPAPIQFVRNAMNSGL